MQISANHITLEVEEHGSRTGEPLVLIMGLGMQLVAWPDDFVQRLVARSFRVIRFDNRDIGLSQSFDHLASPNLALAAIRDAVGLRVRSPYTLADMAEDTAAMLEVLGIARAHVCGASLGGMVAQQLAVRHPNRVKSLTLMMTSSGSRRLPGPTLQVRCAMLSSPADPTNLDRVVDHQVRLFRLIGSPGYPSSEEYLRQRLSLSVRRSYRPRGTARQLLAIAADGDRSALLSRISMPTHVLHGTADPLVPVAAGVDLAARIPGVRGRHQRGRGESVEPLLCARC